MGNSVPILLFFITALIVAFIFFYKGVDGFVDNATALQAGFIEDRRKNYNPIGISLIAAGTEGTLGTSADGLMGTVGDKTAFPLTKGKSGLFATISQCEAITTPDCSAFDDPNFSAKCGLCLDPAGVNSAKLGTNGGLVLLAKERNVARKANAGKKDRVPNYSPTIGTCPANRLVSNKAECIRLTRELQCQKSGSYDLAECSQCYDDLTYTIVTQDPSVGVITGNGTLMLVGSGKLTYSNPGHDTVSQQLSNTPLIIPVEGPEGTRVTLSVTGVSGKPPVIAGGVFGDTQSGTFVMDLYRIVLIDTNTGRRPNTTKTQTITHESTSVTATGMRPGFGKKQMTLTVVMPFTFVDMASGQADICPKSPFVTQKASSEFLNSDPCYSKGSGPGKFSLECLQSLFVSNSCTDAGKGYPKDAATAAMLMANKDGSFRSLSDIADLIYNSAVTTSTGLDINGKKMSILKWSAASEFCTGVAVSSPCDMDPVDTGPLSLDCLTYLWNNAGGADPAKSTYNPVSMASSLFKTPEAPAPRFCQQSGTLSPLDPNGNTNTNAVAHWNSLGSMNAVKAAMKEIHTNANAASLSDEARMPYFIKCYGNATLAPSPKSLAKLIQTNFNASPGNIVGKVNITEDYILSFDFTPHGTIANWGNLLHFTDQWDWGTNARRSPGIWFAPNTVNTFAIHVATDKDVHWAARPTVQYSLGQKIHFSLKCKGAVITVTIGSSKFSYSQLGKRSAGLRTVYGGAPWYPSANCKIENLEYQPLGNGPDLTTSTPANAPLDTFQQLWERAGCTRKLTDGDPHWWRTQTWSTVLNDMSYYTKNVIPPLCGGAQPWHREICLGTTSSCSKPSDFVMYGPWITGNDDPRGGIPVNLVVNAGGADVFIAQHGIHAKIVVNMTGAAYYHEGDVREVEVYNLGQYRSAGNNYKVARR